MYQFPKAILSIILVTAAFGSMAQTDAEHVQHHPNAPAQMQRAAERTSSVGMPAQAEMMADMQSKMRGMHEKMMNANSPDEKQALMAEHMKTMKNGMAMMSMMGGAGMADMKGKMARKGTMAERQKMLEMRMGMLESMMQMMMDQMPQSDTK